MTPAFSAEHTPLEMGTTLIQASAGTGKTYTITALFLRLLLEARLEVRQILVTTYTEAATAELRERIRERLISASAGFAAGRSDDPVVAALLERIDHAEGSSLLTRAMRELDQAMVVTIHGFCQRILRERAFESGLLFDVELVTDRRPLLEQVTDDFWRLHLAGASPLLAAAAKATKITRDTLLELLEATAHRPFIAIDPDLPDTIEALQQECAELFRRLCDCWGGCSGIVKKALLAEPRWAHLKQPVGQRPNLDRWFPDLDACLRNENAAARDLSFLGSLSNAALKKATLKGKTTPCHEFFDLCDEWQTLAAKVPVILKAHFIRWSREELLRRKLQGKILHFDDLLTRLHDALHGSGGDVLAALLRERFRAALIDEFQDTDDIQAEIFGRIFSGPDLRLYLIGDPKQAIYGFRGADVFAYLKAAAAAHRHYTLGTNWRSEALLVDGVSTIFQRNPAAFVEDGIALDDVSAAGKRDTTPMLVAGKAEPPLKLWTWEAQEPLKNGTLSQELPASVAQAIARLLASSATIGGAPLRASQIAVLAAQHREARELQDALNAARIPSVLMSEESVWHTAEARDFQTLLVAIAEYWREPLVRAALATELLGFDAAEVESLGANESAWEAQLGRFAKYHAQWCDYGFIQMFRTLLRDEKVRTRLLSYPDGDRRVTNLFHLSELLQRAATDQRLRPQAALRWFAEQRSRPGNGRDDATVLRLERDDDAVQIITMHRSKGLQFEVVFCPFLWHGVDRRKNGKPILFHAPQTRRLTVALETENDDLTELIRREKLAERVRLTYVALTRAMHQCHFYWDRIFGQEASGAAWILHGKAAEKPGLPGTIRERMKSMSAAEFASDLSNLCAAAPKMIELRKVGDEDHERTARVPLRTASTTEIIHSARRFNGAIDRTWSVSSFSSLIAGASSEVPDYDEARPAAGDSLPDTTLEAIHQFPAGTRTGLCFHAILQHLDFSDLSGLKELVTRHLQLASFSPDRWLETVAGCLERTMAVPLHGGFNLGQVSPEQRLNELEFYLPVNRLDESTVATLLEREESERLHIDRCRGWLKGFIDLVFEQKGKFYILDWKSNHLGHSATDYDQPGLVQAMASHHYTLQLRLYTVALHRYLQIRKPGYDYDQHFGGAFYVFLRGVDPMHPDRGIYFERPDLTRIEAFSEPLGPR
ncbi:MAG: exodeoxyribonuclease V subunit beta [Chthoniobacteraceae bacterium]